MSSSSGEFPILFFVTAMEWRTWLEKNHKQLSGVWVRFFKKNSGVPTITYDEALDEALCYGWIDSKVRSYDEKSYLQKFTPRRSKSIWSKRNREHINRLIQAGKMQPAGLLQVAEAKKDGRWDAAYDSSATISLPTEFVDALSQHTKAKAFFETLDKANLYAIAWRLQTAKRPETKVKRIRSIIAMLELGQKFHE